MNSFQKILYIGASCLALSACGGSSSGGSTNGGGNGPNVIKVPGVNIGNMAALPVSGKQTSTALVVTNNSNSNLTLVSGTITQNATTSQININAANDSTYGMVNVGQCATLQAGGTCSVSITTPKTSGNYLLTLNFVDANNKAYTTSQVVVYTNTIPAANGFTYSNLNNNLYNAPDGSTTYVIPFVLDNDYTTLYSYSNNPAFATSFSCPGGTTYTKGDLCNLYIRVSGLGDNPKVIATVTVSTQPNPIPPLNAQTNGKSKLSIKGTVGFSFSTSVTVSNSVTGNIVSSAFNIVVNPANGVESHAQTVTLLNNGSATVTGITITPVGGIINITNSGSGSCATAGNSLAPNSSCTFSVNANTGTSGSNTVNVTYNNGGVGNTNGITPFTVVYISAIPGPGMSMTAGQGSLQNVTIGSTATLNIQVKNTGNVLLTNIGFTGLSAPFGYDPTSTCATNGTQSLPAGASCTLIVDYSPTVVDSGTLTINQTATYIDQGGQSNTYQGSSFSTTYSSAVGNAFVYMTPNSVSYAIRADNADTASQVITVANYGGRSVTLDSPSYTESGLSGISSNIHITDGCAGATLTANDGNTCNLSVTFGPAAATIPVTNGYLFVPYKPNPLASTANAFSAQSFQAESAALVTVSAPVKSGAAGGSPTQPYTFYNSPVTGKPIVLTYTYTNSGTQNANHFIVSLNNLPVGWILQSSTCGNGATESVLATSSACTVAISAIGPNTMWNPYSFSGAINVVTPSFSYNDSNTGLNTGPASPATTQVTAMLFANVGESPLAGPSGLPAESATSYNFNITFASTAGDSTQYPVTVTIPSTSLPQGPSSGKAVYVTSTAVGGNQCTITTATGSCPINLTNTGTAVAQLYNFQYWVTPTGLTPSAANSITNYFVFTLN